MSPVTQKVVHVEVILKAKDVDEINSVRSQLLSRHERLETHSKTIFKETFLSYKNELTEQLKVYYYAELDKTADEQAVVAIHEKAIERNETLFNTYLDFLTGVNEYYNHVNINIAKCTTKPEHILDEVDLVPLSLPDFKEPKCNFKKEINNEITRIKFNCNQIDKSGEIEERKSNVSPGTGYNGARSNKPGNTGPGKPARGGPQFHLEEINEFVWRRGPLNAEVKDLSQFSIEFDRWGNMTGMKFQLNKEGTALADPDSKESGIDSRWSWNALASPKKGFLNKLVIK